MSNDTYTNPLPHGRGSEGAGRGSEEHGRGGQSEGKLGRLLQLRILVPFIILFAFALDVGSRVAVAPARLAFRGWEAATSSTATQGPFTPNLVYYNERSYGDLANLGNLPSIRQYHPELFTTDSWGFRITPAAEKLPVSILIFGDSFTGGAGLSDEDTLTSQVSTLGGVGAYNGGNVFGSDCWPVVETLIGRFKLKNRLIVYQYSEGYDIPEPDAGASEVGTRVIRRVLSRDSSFYEFLRSVRRLYSYSPLQVLLSRRLALIQDDVWLPNIAARGLALLQLRNGQRFAFIRSDIADFEKSRTADIDFFVKLQLKVRSTGNELLVIFVPSKYNVYYPLLDGPYKPAKESPYLNEVEKKLSAAHIPVLDPTAKLREQAAALLPDGKYNYRIDDTHWNAAGVRTVAKAIIAFQGKSPAARDQTPLSGK